MLQPKLVLSHCYQRVKRSKGMTVEERQRTMDFVVTQQAQFAVNFDKAEVCVCSGSNALSN